MEEKKYVASLSYGKDSMAMLHVITDVLHWPLDRIITADVWATDTIPADLPPMWEFKKKADKEIKERWGIEVEHFQTHPYEREFYRVKTHSRTNRNGDIYGWPFQRGPWCNWDLKMRALAKAKASTMGEIQYVGIAVDEPIRVKRHINKEGTLLPLVEADWTEQDCMDWCKENGLLSPTYETSFRDGCWFCHNQGINQLRNLRKNYPELWALMLKWDNDSPVSFKPDGRTVHDYDRRFQWEDDGYKPRDKQFRWEDVEFPQMNIDQCLKCFGGDNN